MPDGRSVAIDRAHNRRIFVVIIGDDPARRLTLTPPVHSEEVQCDQKLLHRDGSVTYVLVFDHGDEVISGPTAFAKNT